MYVNCPVYYTPSPLPFYSPSPPPPLSPPTPPLLPLPFYPISPSPPPPLHLLRGKLTLLGRTHNKVLFLVVEPMRGDEGESPELLTKEEKSPELLTKKEEKWGKI